MEKDFKRIQNELKKYGIPAADFSDLQKTLIAGKRLLAGKQYQQVSFFDRIKTQIKYISLSLWILQSFLLLLCLYLMGNIAAGSGRQMLLSVTSFFVAIIALVGFPELCRSFSYGMWELEQVCKYNLRQLVSLKMAILGIADLICMISISLLCSGYSTLPFWQVGVYLLVPFNIVCICGFLLISFFRGEVRQLNIWVLGGIAIAALFVISNRFSIYTIDFSAWLLGLIVSIAISGMLIIRFLNDLKREDITCN